MVSDCRVKRLGELPFEFGSGDCGTFIIEKLSIILLCFSSDIGYRKCRSLTRKNDGLLGDINDFDFDSEFQIDRVDILDSIHAHSATRIANYQGYPLILGGGNNNKLEMLNTMENPPRWVEYEETEYPYSNM